MRVAYIEEKEVIVKNRTQKVYSSVLIKGENNFDQVMILEIRLTSRNIMFSLCPRSVIVLLSFHVIIMIKCWLTLLIYLLTNAYKLLFVQLIYLLASVYVHRRSIV